MRSGRAWIQPSGTPPVPHFVGRRWNLTAAIVVGGIVAVIGVWAQNDALVGVNYDDGIYALLAKSVAAGGGYGLAYLDDLPGVKYPPVYPLSLVPFWKFAPTQETALHAMKIANGIYIGLAAGFFAFVLVELKILSLPFAAGVALVGFASGSMMLVSSGLLSEPLYMILLSLALWRADSVREHCGTLCLLSIGALAAIVALTRMAGLALVAAVMIGLYMRYGRRGPLISFLSAAGLLAPWLLFTLWGGRQVPEALIPHHGSYARLYFSSIAGSPSAALHVAEVNLRAIFQTLGSLVVPQAGSTLRPLLGALVLGLSLLGAKRILLRAPATAVYPWIYLVLVVVWTFPPFRFLFILFPLLLALSTVTVLHLIERVAHIAIDAGEDEIKKRKRRTLITASLAALLVLNMGYRQTRALYRRVWDGAQLQKSAAGAELIEWVRTTVPTNAVIAYEFDPLIALHTGRIAVPNNTEAFHPWYRTTQPDVEPLVRLLREMNVEYLAVRRYIPAAVEPIGRLIGRYPDALHLVHVTPGGVLVFRTQPAALGAGEEEPGSPALVN